MASGTKYLKNLLNCTEAVHKKDISDYAHGHLNETHLLNKDVSYTKHRPWKSSSQPSVYLKPRKNVCYHDNEVDTEMLNVMRQFSLGTSGMKVIKKSDRLKTPVEEKDNQSLYSLINDDVLIEEYMVKSTTNFPPIDATNEHLSPKRLYASAAMNNKLNGVSVKYKQQRGNVSKGTKDATHTASALSHATSVKKLQDILKLRNDVVVPGTLHGVTKKDQFTNHQAYVSHVVKTKDAVQQGALPGTSILNEVTSHVYQQLEHLSFDDGGPSDEKLAIYKNAFASLVHFSPIFGHILAAIMESLTEKRQDEYDLYVAYLRGVLAGTSHHELVAAQVRQMTAGGTSQPYHLQEAMEKLQSQETLADAALERNNQLRSELKEEMFTKYGKYGSTSESEVCLQWRKLNVSDDIENIKASILEKLDEIEVIKCHMKVDSVPATVCNNLENCIKETEIEVQKLLKQNEYFEQSIKENEDLLRQAIVDADTSERDARRIWQRIDSTSELGRKGFPCEEFLEDADDEIKWAWYIS